MDRQTDDILFDLKLRKDHELFNHLLKQGKVGIKEAKEIIAKEVLKLRVGPNDKRTHDQRVQETIFTLLKNISTRMTLAPSTPAT